MIRKQVQITGAQEEGLKAAAAKNGVSEAELMRTALDRLLGFGPTINERQRRILEEFLDTAKKVRSDKPQDAILRNPLLAPRRSRYRYDKDTYCQDDTYPPEG